MMIKTTYVFSFLLHLWASAFAQVDYPKQYANAKQLFKEGKYNLAMESFKPLIPYDKENSFSEYASFYYALAAYHQGYLAVAKDELNRIKTLYPKWDKKDEINYWLGKIHFDNHEYFQGLKVLSSVEDKKMQKDIDVLKAKSLEAVTDMESLKSMREQYPKDEAIARALANALSNRLSKGAANAADKALLETLIKNHNFKRAEFIPEAPKSFHKDIYSVSVLMPFMVNTLEPTPSKKRNQIVLDFYEGLKLAVDTLSKLNIQISLRAYDTERNITKINNILNTDELKNTDLIIGPFFQEENKPIQDFSFSNRINIINPFFNNSDATGQNPYGFLFQPSIETIGKKTGSFLAHYTKNKNCLVFYGSSKRDSLLAANFVASARENGLKVLSNQLVPKGSEKNITTLLATPTEYDQFRYPKEFTLKKDSIGCIFVATDDPLIYTKVVNAVETRDDGIIVAGSENWLEQTAIDLDKYNTLPIVFAAPNYVSADRPVHEAFFKRYINTYGRVPSAHARLGYELMQFMGNQLKQHGVYFQEGFNQQGFIPGYLYEGYNYQFSRSNQLVPFIRFDEGNLKVVDKK